MVTFVTIEGFDRPPTNFEYRKKLYVLISMEGAPLKKKKSGPTKRDGGYNPALCPYRQGQTSSRAVLTGHGLARWARCIFSTLDKIKFN